MSSFLFTYINDVLQGEWMVFDWENVEFGCALTKNYRLITFGFACFDNAGNQAYESVNGTDIKSFIVNQRFLHQKFFNRYFQHFIDYFKNLFFQFLKDNIFLKCHKFLNSTYDYQKQNF